jgi:hypothetical protein
VDLIPKEDELKIIELIVNIQTCAILFQYSLVRVDRLATVSHLLGRLHSLISRCCTSIDAAVG